MQREDEQPVEESPAEPTAAAPPTSDGSETAETTVGSDGDGSGSGSIFTDPLFVEVVAVLILFGLSAILVRKLASIAKGVSERRNLREFIHGMDAFFKKDYRRAIQLLSAVVEKDPENAEARICLGDAYRCTGDAAEAHKHHYHVQEIFGRDLVQNHLSLAKDLVALNRLGEAQDHLARVLEERPQHLHALRLSAEIHERLGSFPAAVEVRRSLLNAVSRPKEEASERRALARVLALAGSRRLDDGDLKRGVPLLEEAVKISPGLVRPRMEMVRAKLIEGSEKGARKVFRQQFKEMKELMKSDDFVFEPSSPLLAIQGTRGRGAAPTLAPPGAAAKPPTGTTPTSGSRLGKPSAAPRSTPAFSPLGVVSSSPQSSPGRSDDTSRQDREPHPETVEAIGAPAPNPKIESLDSKVVDVRTGSKATDPTASTPGAVLIPPERPGSSSRGPRSSERHPSVPPDGDDGLLPPDVESVGEFLDEILRKEAPYHCVECGRASAQFVEQCPECSAWGSLTETDTTYLSEVRRLGELLDEVDENDAYLIRLIKRLASADPVAGEKLRRSGSRGMAAVFRELKSSRTPAAPLLEFLQSLGAHSLPEITEAFLKVVRAETNEGVGGTLTKIKNAAASVPGTLLEETSWLTGSGKRSRTSATPEARDLDAVFARLVLGFGEDGVHHHKRNLDSDHPGVRRASLIGLLRFGEPDILDELPLAVSTKEIIVSLHEFEDDVLRSLLRRANPSGSFSQEILTDRTFRRADLLVSHLTDPESAATVTCVLAERGFSPEVYEAVQKAHGDGVADSRIEAILRGYGADATDHLISSLADPICSPGFCEVAARVVRGLGPLCVPRLVENLEGKETPQELRMAQLVVGFGEEAVDPLIELYVKVGKGGLLARGKSRGRQRKERLLSLLDEIGGKRVKKGLKPLVKKETDDELRRRLEDVIGNSGRR